MKRQRFGHLIDKLFDFFSSLKLAVILILTLATILAVGTFYEAAHGTADAHRVIYKSWFVSVEMFLLIVNLACAAIDRMPWKKHHLGFVITHAGIITLIAGSFITQQRGLDGSVALGIGESAEAFSVEDTELHIYQSLNGTPFATLIQQPIDFDRTPPEKNEIQFGLVDQDHIRVTHYIQKAVRKTIVTQDKDETSQTPSALEFQLANDRVNVNEWLGLDNRIPPFYDLGPASISFIRGSLPKQPQPRNQIVVYQDQDSLKARIAIFSSHKATAVFDGSLETDKEYDTGWMGLKFKIIHFYPHALSQISYVEATPDDKESFQVIEARVNQGPPAWFELDSPHEIKGEKSTYFVSFVHRRYQLGFRIDLQKFKMGTYGGTALPMSYESTVSVDRGPPTVVSMNEPLKAHGLTLYQSSFEQNEHGEPVVSVFAVNYDPGRPIKYAGSLGIVLGIAVMFYFKPKWTRKSRQQEGTS